MSLDNFHSERPTDASGCSVGLADYTGIQFVANDLGLWSTENRDAAHRSLLVSGEFATCHAADPRVLQQFVDSSVHTALQEQEMMAQEGGLVSWLPFRTLSDHNCLCHSVAIALWGKQDKDFNLRNTLLRNMESDTEAAKYFREQWIHVILERDCLNFGMEIERSSDEWDREWQNEIQAIKDTSCSLTEIHLFVMAHIVRRPIIVYSPAFYNDVNGQAMAPIYFGGVYLPVLLSSDNCASQCPVFLAYCHSHLTALIPTEVPNFQSMLAPLVDHTSKPLPIHYVDQGLFAPGSGAWKELLQKYLVLEMKAGTPCVCIDAPNEPCSPFQQLLLGQYQAKSKEPKEEPPAQSPQPTSHSLATVVVERTKSPETLTEEVPLVPSLKVSFPQTLSTSSHCSPDRRSQSARRPSHCSPSSHPAGLRSRAISPSKVPPNLKPLAPTLRKNSTPIVSHGSPTSPYTPHSASPRVPIPNATRTSPSFSPPRPSTARVPQARTLRRPSAPSSPFDSPRVKSQPGSPHRPLSPLGVPPQPTTTRKLGHSSAGERRPSQQLSEAVPQSRPGIRSASPRMLAHPEVPRSHSPTLVPLARPKKLDDRQLGQPPLDGSPNTRSSSVSSTPASPLQLGIQPLNGSKPPQPSPQIKGSEECHRSRPILDNFPTSGSSGSFASSNGSFTPGTSFASSSQVDQEIPRSHSMTLAPSAPSRGLNPHYSQPMLDCSLVIGTPTTNSTVASPACVKVESLGDRKLPHSSAHVREPLDRRPSQSLLATFPTSPSCYPRGLTGSPICSEVGAPSHRRHSQGPSVPVHHDVGRRRQSAVCQEVPEARPPRGV